MVVSKDRDSVRRNHVKQINIVTKYVVQYSFEIDGDVIGIWGGKFVVLDKSRSTKNNVRLFSTLLSQS